MEEIQIKIKTTINSQLLAIEVTNNFKISQLKKECEKLTKIPSSLQNLVYEGQILINERKISDYGIKNNSTIFLVKKQKIEQKEENNLLEVEKASNNIKTNSNNKGKEKTIYELIKSGELSASNLSTIFRDIEQNDLNDFSENFMEFQKTGITNVKTLEKLLSNPFFKKLL